MLTDLLFTLAVFTLYLLALWAVSHGRGGLHH
jgi:hypothetical protein